MERKLLVLPLLAFSVFMSFALVSAETFIMGTIYNEDFSEEIGDANITVECKHNNETHYRNTTSFPSGDQIGDYVVSYLETGPDACDGGDMVTVTAVKGDLHGSASEIVVEDMIDNMDIAIINVPMVPEFGFILGALTLLSAVGIFFVVRRN